MHGGVAGDFRRVEWKIFSGAAERKSLSKTNIFPLLNPWEFMLKVEHSLRSVDGAVTLSITPIFFSDVISDLHKWSA